jgi:hypothetical protein
MSYDPIASATAIANAKQVREKARLDGISAVEKYGINTKTIRDPYVNVPAPTTDLIDERIKKLPTVKSPELINQELEAEIHRQIAEQQRILQEKAEKQIETVKKTLETYTGKIPSLPAVPKLPIIDPKFLAAIAYDQLKNKIREAKQKVTKKNVAESVKKFKYPMAPKLPKVPEIPEIPKLPTIAVPKTLPEIPNL